MLIEGETGAGKELAARAVAATRYPPEGMRGVSVSQRGNRYGTVADYFKGVNEQIAANKPFMRLMQRHGREPEWWELY